MPTLLLGTSYSVTASTHQTPPPDVRCSAHELAHVTQQRTQGIAANGVLFRSENGTDTETAKAEVAPGRRNEKAAAKNAWSGVARTYESIEKLGDEALAVASNAGGIHMLGAQAARNLGDIRRYKTLLLLAKTSLQAAGGAVDEATLQAVEAELSQIRAAYGVVCIARARSQNRRRRKRHCGARNWCPRQCRSPKIREQVSRPPGRRSRQPVTSRA